MRHSAVQINLCIIIIIIVTRAENDLILVVKQEKLNIGPIPVFTYGVSTVIGKINW